MTKLAPSACRFTVAPTANSTKNTRNQDSHRSWGPLNPGTSDILRVGTGQSVIMSVIDSSWTYRWRVRINPIKKPPTIRQARQRRRQGSVAHRYCSGCCARVCFSAAQSDDIIQFGHAVVPPDRCHWKPQAGRRTGPSGDAHTDARYGPGS